MIRALHRWPGLVALVLVTVLALNGAALSVFPMAEQLAAPQAVAGQSVADLAARVASLHPGLEEIRRAPSGRITAWWFDGGTPGSAVIDPATGADVGPADPIPVERWLTWLHRSLFQGDAGRLVMAAGGAAMLVLTLSGAALVARRTVGWRRKCHRRRTPVFRKACGDGDECLRLRRGSRADRPDQGPSLCHRPCGYRGRAGAARWRPHRPCAEGSASRASCRFRRRWWRKSCTALRGKAGPGALAALPVTAAHRRTRNGPGKSGIVTARPIRATLDPAMTCAPGTVMSLPGAMPAPPRGPATCKAPGRH